MQIKLRPQCSRLERMVVCNRVVKVDDEKMTDLENVSKLKIAAFVERRI